MAMGFKISKVKDKFLSLASPFKRDLMYGRSSVLRKMANYPFPFPIKFIVEHGVDAVQIDLFEKNSNPDGYLVFSALKAQNLKTLGKKNVIQIPDPFTYVVNEYFSAWVPQLKLSRQRDPEKLLFFYAHSTDLVADMRGRDEYLGVIRNYLKSFDLTVCLHFSDVKRGLGEYLSSNGIKWTFIPEYPRSKFPYRFFSLVDKFGKAASTLPGSYLYYCHYVGIDFELVNLPPNLVNLSDNAQTSAFVGFFDEFPNSTAYDLFCSDDKSDGLSVERDRFVTELLGYDAPIMEEIDPRGLIQSALWGSLKWKS
jgi:hypothetical protein